MSTAIEQRAAQLWATDCNMLFRDVVTTATGVSLTPVLTQFFCALEALLPDAEMRYRILLPLVAPVAVADTSAAAETARCGLAASWLCRECVPLWLELLPEFTEFATNLRNAPLNRGALQTALAASFAPARNATIAALRGLPDERDDLFWRVRKVALDTAKATAWRAASMAAQCRIEYDTIQLAADDIVEYVSWYAVFCATRGVPPEDAVAVATACLKETADKLQQSVVQLAAALCAETGENQLPLGEPLASPDAPYYRISGRIIPKQDSSGSSSQDTP